MADSGEDIKWPELEKKPRLEFEPTAQTDMLRLMLEKRKQLPDEPTVSYINEAESLCRRIDNKMSQDEMLKSIIFALKIQRPSKDPVMRAVNRYGVADTLFPDKIRESEPCEDIMISETNDDQKNKSRSSSEISEDNDDTDKTLNFNITLTHTEWDSLYDGTPQIYRRSDGKIDCRSYCSLKPYNWTSVIHEHFFEQTKLPCSMVYKHAKIYPNGQIFLNILGHCSTCKSIFMGILNSYPDENVRVIIRCTMTGQFKNYRSYSKRRIIEEKKEDYINKLKTQNMAAAYIQRTEAKKVKDYGDNEPSHIPSLNALRLIKHKSLLKDHIHENPLISISLLKGTPPYNNIIREIGYDKFFMHFWTSAKINNYRNYLKTYSTPTISIDATGSVVKKINLFSGRQ
ncbi:jerky protein-like, partial [Aphis craccivora]